MQLRKLAASLAIIFWTVVAAGGQQINTGLKLPLPTGAYPVGRKRFIWKDDGRSGRPVKVDVWYPTDSSGEPLGDYLPDLQALLSDSALAVAIRQRYGPALPSLEERTPRANAHDDAQIAQKGRPFPLLLFSHGLGGSPYEYSIQLEDLASHGYVVAAVEHVHDTLGVVLPGKGVVAFDGQLWGRYASPSEPETIRFYEERAVDWAQDLVFAMQRLATLSATKDSPFFQVIDLRRIGAFGHSHGGRSAATACMLDSRIKACLNEDGRLDETQLQRPYWPLPGRQFSGVFTMFDWFDPGLDAEDYAGMHTTPMDYARARLKPSGATLETYRSPGEGSYHVTMLRRGMSHTAFTDLRWLTATSQADRTRYVKYLDVIRLTVLDFFDTTLRGNPSHIFVCDSVDGQALVQCYRPIQKN